MAEPFKNLVDRRLVAAIGTHVSRHWPRFDAAAFGRVARRGLEALELKARVRHVSGALERFLPESFAAAADVLEAALAPARDDTNLAALVTDERGLAGWDVWPLTDYVARCGLPHPERALRALHAMTQRHTAEFAIRPFLREHRDVALQALHRWAGDDSAHVRRLVSEGSRPRLPWGELLQDLIADPSPTLPLLLRLQDDPSDYVRRSVANHLNDIAKDHPEVVADWIARHAPDAGKERIALLRRAGRTLVKQGHRGVLAAFGSGAAFRGEVTFVVAPQTVRVGGAVAIEAELHSRAARPQRLVVDYVVHQVRGNGATAAKVWKGWVLDLPPRERRALRKRHSLKPVTTRRDHPGWHAVELRVNGRSVATSGFELLAR